MPSPLETVLARLPSAKKQNGYWMALCPAHSDTSPSLSIREGIDKRVILNCFANCPWENVVSALNLEQWQLYCSTDKSGKPFQVAGPAKSKVIATYPYLDADGTLLYEVVRKFPKAFVQRQPDGSGGWIYNMEGAKRVLYRLPQLIEGVKNGERVYIVEGEKDAETLASFGLISTTNSGGSEKWERCFSLELEGASVAILPDNDAAGEEHAQTVAYQLLNVASEIKVIKLPNLEKKGDVSDWVEAGGTKEQLLSLAELSSPWMPSQDPKSESYIRNFDIEKIEKVGDSGSIYYVHVFGCAVKMSIAQLSSFSSFITVVSGEADRRPDIRNAKDWGPYVDECLRTKLVKLAAPEDANKEGMIWHHICRYMKKADEDEKVLAEKRGPWSNEKYLYFHGPSLQHYLSMAGIRFESENELWDILRKRGGIAKVKQARDSEGIRHGVRAWLIEKTKVTDIEEEPSESEQAIE